MNSSIEKQQKGRHIRYVRNNRLDNKITFLLCTEKKINKKEKNKNKRSIRIYNDEILERS